MSAKDKISIDRGDITTYEVDAVVNAANKTLLGGGGVDGAIHRAAGPELKEACKTFGGCETGDAKITAGFNLKAKYVIHAVGPVWSGGMQNEADLLASCYRRSLEIAIENNVKTIAFPSISTGAYRFPFNKACNIALTTIIDFLETHESLDKVHMVMFSENDFEEMKEIFKGLS